MKRRNEKKKNRDRVNCIAMNSGHIWLNNSTKLRWQFKANCRLFGQSVPAYTIIVLTSVHPAYAECISCESNCCRKSSDDSEIIFQCKQTSSNISLVWVTVPFCSLIFCYYTPKKSQHYQKGEVNGLCHRDFWWSRVQFWRGDIRNNQSSEILFFFCRENCCVFCCCGR